MKILQVSGYESPGRRFNGLSVTPLLKKHGIESRHLVWEKDTKNPDILSFGGRVVKKINRLINRFERITSLQSMFYLNGSRMMKMQAFKEADLVHLHIIHSGYFSMSDLPKISHMKPVVWTLHDPWALTGHCIHPFDCKRWMIGCGSCPDLKTEIPLLVDNTRFLFNYKRKAYEKSKLDIIVASKWMQNMVEKSPMFENARIHNVPFGLNLDFFSPIHTKTVRKQFSISDDTIVISFRSAGESKFKGLPYIIQALDLIKTDKQICLLTLGRQGSSLLEQFNNRFRVIDLKWIDDEEITRDIIAASDIFLMPSTAEAFGMMAIEAMACGKPVITFDGTALPRVIFAPEVGISVPMRDGVALYHALQRLIDNPEERKERGQKARTAAELHYNEEVQAERLAEIYKMVINR